MGTLLHRLASRSALAVTSLVCATSVGAALVGQHHFGMQPCPWCILQRMLFIALAVLTLLAAGMSKGVTRRLMAILALPLAVVGIAAALWQHFVAAPSGSCAMTLADRIITAIGLDTRWPDVFEVRASCADAAVSVFGVPFEFWSLALFALVILVLAANSLPPPRKA